MYAALHVDRNRSYLRLSDGKRLFRSFRSVSGFSFDSPSGGRGYIVFIGHFSKGTNPPSPHSP